MQEAHHGQTPGATLLTAATKFWHEPSLPPEAVIVHWLAYWAPTTASSGQQDDRLAQAPAEEPPQKRRRCSSRYLPHRSTRSSRTSK